MREGISALEIKMINNHQKLMKKIETVEKKTDKAIELAKKNEAEINEIINQVQIKNELASELNLALTLTLRNRLRS